MKRGAETRTERRDDAPRDHLLDRLFRSEAPRLARFIRKSVGNQDEVQDLVQETFVSFVAAARTGKLRTPEAYLRTIARNLLWGRARRPQHRDALHLPVDEDFEIAVAPEQEWMMEASDFLRRYEQALAELPARTREVFRLHRQEDLTYQQIAERLGLNVRAVKYHMRKALLYLDSRVNTDD
ncbi:RNA polymerase sigma factor [Novosphingobium album (ex Liu et al. 2023)]|uniref:Sigma-70 family RNA polymerase sigma factor n=1 Tax=Novosphingobium album (ex Liu et al. 2023) TaxID=3031130 RepID=A0ABT5WQE5_9SPHN|nr:sigma-70 family RNA polymerase sigma factor [Novosphingobium album (ex Liu et al. 2023)]MDE8652267.1 sigma-70 family RNA polymerase sigma factor [Novosphingobium album (ex Liu et al. 2023)]